MGVSPVVMRSPAGVSDSTKSGLVAAKSRINLSAFSLPMILCRLASHCAVVVCWLGSGTTTFPLYCGLTRFSGNPVGDFVRRGTPIIHIQARFLFERSGNEIHRVVLDGSVHDDLAAFLFGRLDQFGVLGENQTE